MLRFGRRNFNPSGLRLSKPDGVASSGAMCGSAFSLNTSGNLTLLTIVILRKAISWENLGWVSHGANGREIHLTLASQLRELRNPKRFFMGQSHWDTHQPNQCTRLQFNLKIDGRNERLIRDRRSGVLSHGHGRCHPFGRKMRSSRTTRIFWSGSFPWPPTFPVR